MAPLFRVLSLASVDVQKSNLADWRRLLHSIPRYQDRAFVRRIRMRSILGCLW